MKTIIIASNNAHKAQEIKNILTLKDCEFLTLREAGISVDPDENANTYLGNARIKAHDVMCALASQFENKACVLADDSGLEVDALDGAPSVHSARFAGENATDAQNNEKLLCALKDVPADKRSARFICQLAFLMPAEYRGTHSNSTATNTEEKPLSTCVKNDTNETLARGMINETLAHDAMGEILARGVMEGKIALEACGAGGFGYDPLFLPTDCNCERSAAELTPDEKNAISHRSRALKNLREELVKLGW